MLIVFEVVADVFAKKYSLSGSWVYWLAAITAYIVGNIFWLWGIRDGSGLARGAVIFSVGTAVASSFVGIYFFGEHISKITIAGMILGIVSLVLILWE